MENILVAKGITKIYNSGSDKHLALNDVSLQINKGEFTVIMGPSGSGKSTLLYVLSGMDCEYDGSVMFDDKNLTALSEKELAQIRLSEMGFVFQQPTMLKNLNILDNIILPAVSDKKVKKDESVNKGKTLMEKLGIAELANRDITEVSGGQLQRAGIARALMNSPKIIFGDEPTGALNSKSANEIINILSSINRDGTTVLLVTHDIKIAASADRVLFMKDGKIESDVNFSHEGKNTIERLDAISVKMRDIGI